MTSKQRQELNDMVIIVFMSHPKTHSGEHRMDIYRLWAIFNRNCSMEINHYLFNLMDIL